MNMPRFLYEFMNEQMGHNGPRQRVHRRQTQTPFLMTLLTNASAMGTMGTVNRTHMVANTE